MDSGFALVSPSSQEKNKLLVFDVSQFKGFERADSEIITILQKVCRFAIKFWQGIGLSPCEKIIPDTTFCAILPFSFVTGKSYKVIVDKAPLKRRQEIRGDDSILVFHDGYEKITAEPILSTFKNACKEFDIYNFSGISTKVSGDSGSSFIQHSEVSSSSGLSPHMGMEFWKSNLTDSQKDFVFSDRLGPDILKGAAGTGKTLSLVLKAIHQLTIHEKKAQPLKAVFFTHSIATKNNLENIIASNGGACFIDSESPTSIKITTLQEWCIENLKGRIEATEYLDKDAMESKNMQLLYINEAFENFKSSELNGANKLISSSLRSYLEKTDEWSLSSQLQYEISTYIKGKSSDNFNVYRELSRLKTAIPLEKEEDFKTIWRIYTLYQEKLIDLNLFDSDDITLSALAEMNSPIWKRRRKNEGFDVLFIDETHLFNFNELSLFHNLLKTDSTNIVFTIDRSQAVGDATISEIDVSNMSDIARDDTNSTKLTTVFRSSPDIMKLGECVLASGATLFNHLENPLAISTSSFTDEEEAKSLSPYYQFGLGQEDIFEKMLAEVNELSSKLKVSRNKILIISCSDEITEKFKEIAITRSIPLNIIERRGDYTVVHESQKSDSYVMGGVDYVGGLEFDGVVIVGADDGSFPRKSSGQSESAHFIAYSSINKLYVAITRAKYALSFIFDKAEGPTNLLKTSIENNLLSILDR